MPNKTAKAVAKKALKKRAIPRKRLQYGALCWRRTSKGVKVLLITSRRTRRWISPKGWPIKGKSPHAGAAQEAFEEAGVMGKIKSKSIGFYAYEKTVSKDKTLTLLVQVFPLEVTARTRKFPERGQRKLKWLKPEKAARLVREPELRRLIYKLAQTVPDTPEVENAIKKSA